MKALLRILLVLLVGMLLVGSVAAQDDTPAFVTLTPMPESAVAVDVAAPVDDALIPAGIVEDLIDKSIGQLQTMSNVQLGFFAVVAVGLFLPVIYALYHSNPAFRSTIKTAALEGFAGVEEFVIERKDAAAENDVFWDDPMWQGIYEAVKTGRLKVEALGNETPAG